MKLLRDIFRRAAILPPVLRNAGAVLALTAILPGCAVWDFIEVRYQNATGYFNTYYNAASLFDEAVEELQHQEQPNLPALERPPLPLPEDAPPGAGMGKPPGLLRDPGMNSAALGKFEKVIEKCSYILVNYPKSKWVDDALLMIGRSFHYKKEFGRAERKFRELLDGYPDGPLYSEGLLWMGKNYISLEFYGKADSMLLLAIERGTKDGNPDVVTDAYYALGELSLLRGQREKAVEWFTKGIDAAPESDQSIRLELALAREYEALGKKTEAADAYRNIVALGPPKELLFNAQLNYARLSRETKQMDEAVNTLIDMLDNPAYLEYDAQIQLEIGHLYRAVEDLKSAVDQYRMVDTTFRNQPVSADASYALGELYEYEAKDYDKAFEYYSAAKLAYPGAESSKKGGKRADIFGEYRRLRNRMNDVDTLLYYVLNPDTLDRRMKESAVQDSLTNLKRLAGGGEKTEEEKLAERFARRRPHGRNTGRVNPWLQKSEPLQMSGLAASKKPGVPSLTVPLYRKLDVRRLPPDSVLAQLSLYRVDMGWTMYSKIGNLDSAMHFYTLALEGYLPDTSRANVYYTLAEIARTLEDSALAREYEDRLIRELPNTRFALGVMQRRGMELPRDSAAIAREAYERAARILEAGDRQGGIAALDEMARSYPRTEQAARAKMAIGLAYEADPGGGPRAVDLYREMLKEYPSSPYSKRARDVITHIDGYEQGKAIAARKAEERRMTDSLKQAADEARKASRMKVLDEKDLEAKRDSVRMMEQKKTNPTEDPDFPLLPDSEYKPKTPPTQRQTPPAPPPNQGKSQPQPGKNADPPLPLPGADSNTQKEGEVQPPPPTSPPKNK